MKNIHDMQSGKKLKAALQYLWCRKSAWQQEEMDPLRLKSIYTLVHSFMEKHIFISIKNLPMNGGKCFIRVFPK